MGPQTDIPPVGVWDQVLEFGRYQHQTVDGVPCESVHDASTCRYMLDDFAAHPDCDIFYDRQHEVEMALGDDALDREKMKSWAGDGMALAWANALVMIMGGQVVRYEPHPGAPQTPPRADDVLMQSDGARRGDGVYSLRSVVTPRGADPKEGLANFRFTSPFYVPERDGNRLLNLTATNDPRMRGCALAFGRVAMTRVPSRPKPVAMENAMADKEMPEHAAIMKAAGCMDDDTPEMKLGKVMAYHAGMAKRMDDMSGSVKRMEDDMGAMEEEARSRMSAQARAKMEEQEKQMGRKMTSAERRAMEADHKEPDGDEGKAAMQAMARDNRALAAKVGVLEGQLEKFTKLLPAIEEQTKESRELKADRWANEAVAMGRYPHDAEGSAEQTVTKLKADYLADPQVAEKMLFAKDKFPRPAEVIAMQRLTERGAGKGAPEPDKGDASAQTKYMQAMTRAAKKVKDQGLPANTDLDALVKRDEPAIHAAQWSR